MKTCTDRHGVVHALHTNEGEFSVAWTWCERVDWPEVYYEGLCKKDRPAKPVTCVGCLAHMED